MKPSATPAAMTPRLTAKPVWKQMNRGSHRGRYFTLLRYSVSSCHHREANVSTAAVRRSTGPEPSCSAPLNTLRSTAKFNDSRRTPKPRAAPTMPATMNSTTPLSASGSRRMRSSDSPRRPHGTNDSRART